MTTGNSLAMLPWFVRDYIAATRHLSLAERGAYTDLLFLSWEMGPLPKDPARLARLVGCGPEEFGLVWPTICEKFIETDAGLINPRLEEHRTEAYRRAQLVSEAARAKAHKRWHRTSNGSAPAMPQHSNGSAPAMQAAMPQQSRSNADAMHPSPYPSPDPDPGSGVLEDSDSRPQVRTARTARRARGGEAFHRQVIEAYHELLPDLPRVKAWSRTRRHALDARIGERLKEGKPADTLEYWRKLFAQVAESDFLCGRSSDFRADLEWLIRPENFLKVIEGRYNGSRAKGGSHAR